VQAEAAIAAAAVQVLDGTITIADRISQKCHRDWTRAFLVSHREVRSEEQLREVRSAEQLREVRSAEQHQGSTQ
jgi:hypothetical protein